MVVQSGFLSDLSEISGANFHKAGKGYLKGFDIDCEGNRFHGQKRSGCIMPTC
jgi:hypothetical protein